MAVTGYSLVYAVCCVALSQSTDTQPSEHDELALEFVRFPPGHVQLGRSVTGDKVGAALGGSVARLDEGPPQEMVIERGFKLAKEKVTAQQYAKFLNDMPRTDAERYVGLNQRSTIERRDGRYRARPGMESCAANTVSWSGAIAFTEWLSARTGKKYRLPTEAEWEYAVKGEENRDHPWASNTVSDEEARRFSREGACISEEARQAAATPEGLIGTAGAVGEWVQDVYRTQHGRAGETVDCDGQPCRVLKRLLHGDPTEREAGLLVDTAGIYGFRVLLEDEPSEPGALGPGATSKPCGVGRE